MKPVQQKGDVNYITSSEFDISKTPSVLSFNRSGEQAQKKEKVLAKIVANDSRDLYYIRSYRNDVFDPLGAHGDRLQYDDQITFLKVKKDIFDLYVSYLKTKNNLYFTKAQRGLLNG